MLLKDRILALFVDCPAPVRKVVSDIIRLEQEHITMERPRVKEAVRQIVERAVGSET